MRRSRRVVYGVVVYGLIGLMVTVLVAWGFAAWGKATSHAEMTTQPRLAWQTGFQYDPSLTWSRRDPRLPGRPALRFVSSSVGVRVTSDWSSKPPEKLVSSHNSTGYGCVAPEGVTLYSVLFGWPMPALRWHQMQETSHPNADVAIGRWIDLRGPGPVSASGLPIPRRLPLEPVWSGLIGNTAMLLGLAGVARWFVTGGRQARRRRCGRCPVCAYDLCGELAGGCPECGWARASTASA